MPGGFCPQCSTPRQGELRYCASCGFDYWKAATEAPPPQAAHTDPATTPGMPRTTLAATTPGSAGRRGRGAVIAAVALVLVVAGVAVAVANMPKTPVAGTAASAAVGSASPRSTPTLAIAECVSGQHEQMVNGNWECVTDTPEPTVAPPPLPTSYATLTARAWSLLVKAPDNYIGKGYKVWACITQFDAATGLDSFRGQASYAKQAYWFTDGVNTFFTGDEAKLSTFVQDDIVYMTVVAAGSYSYDTQNGGNTTVPLFQVVSIRRIGSCAS
jgi:hypothetical protein